MARKRKQLPEFERIEITGVAAEGKAVAKIRLNENDESPMVVFVPFAAPGDIVNIKIDKKKHNFAEGHITKFISTSQIRKDPKCENFGVCGGCKWQHLPYEEQLKFKRQQVEDSFLRIGKVMIPQIPMTLGSEKIWGYRNKMEYTFSNKRWKSWEEVRGEKESQSSDDCLGFHIPGSFDKVLHINECFLQDSLGNSLRNHIFNFAKENDYSFYDIKNNRGLLRTLMIRITDSGEIMVCLVFGERDTEKIDLMMGSIKNSFPQISSLLYVVNSKLNDSISDQEVVLYSGKEYIVENMEDLKFRISAKSFYQTNSAQALRLYKKTAEFAGLSSEFSNEEEKPMVYDLYTGAGTIANFVAKNASKVIGIEYVEDAIKDARINSEINNINNTEFFAGDMKNILTDEFIDKHGRPDIIIVDPPRAGMHEDVVKVILRAAPKTIVYVSCNPATQARDLALLNSQYIISAIQPVDMFPHTHHVENIVRLELRKDGNGIQ